MNGINAFASESALCFAYMGSALVDPLRPGTQRIQSTLEVERVRPRFPVSARNSMFEGPSKGDAGFAEDDFDDEQDLI